jgi:hypothetical protein
MPLWPFRSARAQAAPQSIPLDARALLSALSYTAASNPRTQPRTPGMPAHAHLDPFTRYQLVTRSQELERNCDYYDAAIGNFCTLLVGTGPIPRPLSGTPEWREQARDLFLGDANSGRLDHRRRTIWGPWLNRLARSVVRDGEAWAWHAEDGGALLWEAGAIDQIQLDGNERHSGYRLAGTREILSPAKVSHAAWITRESQTHGHPVLVAGLDDWAELNSLYEAETISAANAARVWVIIQAMANVPGAGAAFAQLGKGGNGNAAAPGRAVPAGWQYTHDGAIMGMPPGLQGTPWSPDRPNVDVPVYVKERMRVLVSPLGPYELIFLDVGALNYAAIRGLRRMGEMIFAPWRNMILRQTIDTIWRNWCRAQILAQRLPYAPGWDRIAWRWPELPIQDREKDALADERELGNGTATLQGILGEDEWQRAQDERAAADLRAAQLRLRTVQKLQAEIDAAGLPLDAAALLSPGGQVQLAAVEAALRRPQPPTPAEHPPNGENT